MTAPACLSALEVIREQGLVQWARLGLNEFCGLLELLDGQLFHEDFLQTCQFESFRDRRPAQTSQGEV